MSVVATIVQGETAPLVIPLLEDGAALDGTGMTVSDVLLTGSDGTKVDTAGKFAWSSQPGGTVAYSPAADDFSAEKSPYKVKVKITDGNSKVRFYPNTKDGAEIQVMGQRA